LLKNKTPPDLGVGVPPVSGFRSNHFKYQPIQHTGTKQSLLTAIPATL